MYSTPLLSTSRRSFLANGGLFGLGVAFLASGCGGSESDAAPTPQLVALFSPDHVIAAGRPQRLPFGLIDQGQPIVGESSDVSVEIHQGDTVIEQLTIPSRIVTHDHPDGSGDSTHEHSDILRYFAVRATLPDPGIYDLVVQIGNSSISLPVQAFHPDEVSVLLPGEPMPRLESPTLADPKLVDPICTRDPEPCPFHSETVASLLSQSRPLAVLVSTPALCVTAYCGPVLEALIGTIGQFPDVAAVHIEVYSNAKEVNFNVGDERIRLAPSVSDLGLEFEPSLFLVDSDGIIHERIDNVFDPQELESALSQLS